MQKPLAVWNPAQDAWVTDQTNLFCEHLDVYSETLPKQGTTLNGILYELPTSVPHTGGSGSSLSPGQDRQENLLSTPQSRDYKGLPADGYNLKNLVRDVTLLPTPAVNDMGKAYDPDSWDEWVAKQKSNHGNGNGHGKSLHIEALRMLPTPRATDGSKGGPNQRGSKGDLMLPSAVHQLLPTPKAGDADFGLPRTSGRPPEKSTHLATRLHYTDFRDYAPAIARWEAITRPVPEPTLPTGKGGKHQLSAVFVEWMMGLPQGWVTDTGISRTEQLKALGNGVVPQQAAEAIKRALEKQ